MTFPSAGFLNQGRKQYRNALDAEEARQLAPLRQQLESEADPNARRALQERIEAVEAEFRKKRRAAGRSLFARQ